ncbi:MJ0042-type zinc finger domain-containing protein [Halorutilales archaeon Cl-col2-1]
MQETWVNVECNSCGETWEVKVSELPVDNGTFRCKECGNESPVKEFLKTEKDLEVYDELK